MPGGPGRPAHSGIRQSGMEVDQVAIELFNLTKGHINEIWKLERTGDRLVLLNTADQPVASFTIDEAGEHITLPNRVEDIHYLVIRTDADEQYLEISPRGEAVFRRALGVGAADQQAGLNARRMKGYLAVLGGLALMAVGVVVTILSFMDERNEGGGVLWWGIVVVGLFVLIGGVGKIMEHRRIAAMVMEVDSDPGSDFNDTLPANLRGDTQPAPSTLKSCLLLGLAIVGIAVLVVIILSFALPS